MTILWLFSTLDLVCIAARSPRFTANTLSIREVVPPSINQAFTKASFDTGLKECALPMKILRIPIARIFQRV